MPALQPGTGPPPPLATDRAAPPRLRAPAAAGAPRSTAPPPVVTVPVGNGPVSVVISPDGGLAYVTDYGSSAVTVLSTVTKAVTATIPVAPGPWGAAVSPDGRRLYVASLGAGTVSTIDTVTNAVIGTVEDMGNPVELAVTPDGARLFVACQSRNAVRVIDTAGNTVTAEIPVGIGPRTILVTPDGGRAYVGEEAANTISVIDTAAGAVLGELTGFHFPRSSAVTPDGRRLFVPNYGGNTVDVLDTATGTVLASIPGFWLPFAVALTGDGLLAYVSCNGDSTVRVVDTGSYRVIADHAGLNVPYGVAITPDQQSVYVANNGDSTVTVLTGPAGLHPYQGPTGGGTRVTLLGTHLTGATAVHFGPRPATEVVVVSDHEITLVTPAGHGVVDVTVTTPGGTSAPMPFYYLPPPRVTGLSPASGPVAGGTTVTLTGTSLATARTVGFGGSAVTPVVLSDSVLTVTTPPGPAGGVPVTVTTIGGVAEGGTYTYAGPPALNALAPAAGSRAGGTVVALLGSGLARTTEVLFDATPAAFTAVTDTLLQAVAPAHAPGAVPVTVTSAGGSATAPRPYTYT
ncbi:IPT/TIG domain-containing protein [Streptomyces kronopolitis]|uniref:IPT/TIG domain-containing protein n=1 Tax=Streptomyces kronopolitis TaxID=1612435 RepID=UPI0034148D8D